MPLAVSGAFVAAMNDVIYVSGGLSLTGEVKTLQAYRANHDRWETLASMPEARYGGSGAQSFDGQFYVVGGWGGQPPSLHDDVFAYDPRQKAWRR